MGIVLRQLMTEPPQGSGALLQDEAGLGIQLNWRANCCCGSFPSTDGCYNCLTVPTSTCALT